MCKKHLRTSRAMSLFAILFTLCFQFISVDNLSAQAVACNKNVQVSIDGITCEAVINPDMILEGSWPDYSLFTVEIEGQPGNVVSEKGDYRVTVTYTPTGNHCWGDIHVEDKIGPGISGISSETACAAVDYPTDFPLAGPTVTLDFEDPNCATLAEFFVSPVPATGTVVLPYTIIPVNVAVSGSYSFTPQGGAACNYVYTLYPTGEFDPMDPCSTAEVVAYGGFSTLHGMLLDSKVCLEEGDYDLVVCSIDPTCADVIRRECNLTCNELSGILAGDLYAGTPVVTECNDYTCSYNDHVQDNECAGTVVTRTWVCVDDCGNASTPYDEVFNLDPVDLNLVTAPDPIVHISCGADADPQAIYDYLVDNGFSTLQANQAAWPTHFGKPLSSPTFCNLATSYTDQTVATCGVGCSGNYKVIRTWNVWNWCDTGSTPTVYIQIIKATDLEAPTIIFNNNNFQYSVDPWGCVATFELPTPDIIHDNCDGAVTYTVSGPAGSVISGTTATNVPVGTHVFTYHATDCCDNAVNVDVNITIVDETAPVAVAHQNIVISLTSSGTDEGLAKLFNTSVDNGSHDGCSAVNLEIRRDTDLCGISGNNTFNAGGDPNDGNLVVGHPLYDTDEGEFVRFCCEDIYGSNGVDVDGDGVNDYGIVKVWLRVWDNNGNYNETWTDVRVEDKLAPQLVCPADVTIDCDDDPSNLHETGEATAYNACDNAETTYSDVDLRNNCNYGLIRRRWSVVGSPGVKCVQDIRVQPGDPFDGDDINWPMDIDTDCTDLGFTGIPTYSSGACDLVAYSMVSDTFLFESGACLKILNRFTVVDWCQHDPNDPDQDNDGIDDGIWYHTQTIKVNDDEAPVITCTDVMLEADDHLDADNDGNICEGIGIMLTNTAMDNGACASDWLKWEVEVDLWGDGTVDHVYSSGLPSNHPYYVAPTSNGGVAKITLVDIDGSMNNHRALWKVSDGCGNTTSCTQFFMVVDKKAPTPYCVNISTALMENGTVDLWAIDFDLGAYDNCSEHENLRFTFSDVNPTNDPTFVPSLSSSAHTFNCDDIPDTPGSQIPINVYVWDEKDNSAFCTVYLTLIDNNNSCGTGTLVASIAGRVATETGQMIEDVEMELFTDAIIGFPINQMSNNSGDYAFYNNPMYLDYEVAGFKNDSYMNGVSTLDLVIIQKHLLNIQQLNSPYKVIAADVNNDGNVSAVDLIELRKLILGIYLELPSNESWRFIDANQTWPNDLSPFPFTESLDIISLSSNMMTEDFIGVKIGDVNNNATVNLGTTTTENRSSATVDFILENQEFNAGQTVKVDFMAKDFIDVVGYQFTLASSDLELQNVISGSIEMNESNVASQKELLTASWTNINGVSTSENDILFSLEFVAKTSGKLSEVMAFTNSVTRTEAYVNGGGSTVDMDLIFRTDGEIEVETYQLFQNEPNPFTHTTVVGFKLPKASNATLNIFDVTGKVIKTVSANYSKGYNEIAINKSDIPVSGIIYYQLESGSFSATKKMIVIE